MPQPQFDPANFWFRTLDPIHRGAGDYRPEQRRIMLHTIVYPN